MEHNFAEDIKAAVDIREAGGRYGLEFDRKGFCRCPFHTEKTASFHIVDRYHGYCFGCGRGADVIALTMELLGLDFSGALRRLNEDFSLGLPIDRKSSLRERMDAINAERQRRRRREEEERAQSAWQDGYDALWDRWAQLDVIIQRLAPERPEDGIPDGYAEALRRIDHASYLIDCYPPEPKRGGDRR